QGRIDHVAHAGGEQLAVRGAEVRAPLLGGAGRDEARFEEGQVAGLEPGEDVGGQRGGHRARFWLAAADPSTLTRPVPSPTIAVTLRHPSPGTPFALALACAVMVAATAARAQQPLDEGAP